MGLWIMPQPRAFYLNKGKRNLVVVFQNRMGLQMKIYISGQITGLDLETAKQNFQIAEDYLRSIGYSDIVNPMKIHPEGNIYTWTQYMRADLKALMDCDAIFLLSNWNQSKGAMIEKRIAEDVELLVLFAPYDLIKMT